MENEEIVEQLKKIGKNLALASQAHGTAMMFANVTEESAAEVILEGEAASSEAFNQIKSLVESLGGKCGEENNG